MNESDSGPLCSAVLQNEDVLKGIVAREQDKPDVTERHFTIYVCGQRMKTQGNIFGNRWQFQTLLYKIISDE